MFHFSNKDDHRPYAEKQMTSVEKEFIREKHNNMPRMIKYRKQFFEQLEQLEKLKRGKDGASQNNA